MCGPVACKHIHILGRREDVGECLLHVLSKQLHIVHCSSPLSPFSPFSPNSSPHSPPTPLPSPLLSPLPTSLLSPHPPPPPPPLPLGVSLDSDMGPTSVFHPPNRETALTSTSTFGPKPFLFVPEQVRLFRYLKAQEVSHVWST